MAYTPPASTACNFTALGYYEPSAVRHTYRFPTGVYAAPVASAVPFVEAYIRIPLGDAANFGVPAPSGIYGHAEATIDITGEAHGKHGVRGYGTALIGIGGEAHGTYTSIVIVGNGAALIDTTGEAHGTHGVRGHGSATIEITAEAHGKHGVRAHAEALIDITASAHGTVVRYELKGEVRSQGILVNRLVRAYRRDTGELVGEASTIAGKFRMHVGFAEREHYIVPLDPAAEAVDWSPPCANRVLSILAQDAA